MIKTVSVMVPLIVVPISLIAAASGRDPQPAPTTLKTGVVQIDVAAVVKDKQGAFVKGLRVEDLEVYEDDVKQDIVNLIQVDLPIAKQDASVPAREPLQKSVLPSERRVYLMVLDDLHIGSEFSEATRRLVKQFVQHNLAPLDVMGIVFTSGVKNGISNFTVDRKQLLAVVDSFIGRKEMVHARRLDPQTEFAAWKSAQAGNPQMGPADQGMGMSRAASGGNQGGGRGFGGTSQDFKIDSAAAPIMADYQRKIAEPDQAADDANAARAALFSMDMLRRLAESMGRISLPRKSIVYFSQGLDYDIDDVTEKSAGNASGVRGAIRDAISLATRNNVAFYPIDPRGAVVTEVGYGARQDNAHSRAIGSLQLLAGETGGFAAVGSNDLTPAFDRLVRENSQYYVIGYYPAKPKDDGKFHRIEVRIRGRADLSVQARRGYLAVDGKRERKDQREREKRERKARGKSPAGTGDVAANTIAPASLVVASPAPTPTAMPGTSVSSSTAFESTEGAASIVASAPTTEAEAAAVAGPSPAAAAAVDVDEVPLPDAMASALADLLGSSTVTPDLPLQLKKISFREAGHNTEASVTVSIDGSIPMEARQNAYGNRVATGLVVLDTKGQVATGTQAVLNLNVSAEDMQNVKTNGTTWTLQFQAEPGRYHVKVAAVEAIQGQKGSLAFEVDVPSYGEDITLNALLVKGTAATRGPSGASQVDARGLPMRATATHVFTQADTLRASAEIYARKPKPMIVVTRLLDAKRETTMEFTEAFAAEDFHNHVCYVYKTLPLGPLEPGQYVLRYEARPTDSATPVLVREVPFAVAAPAPQAAAVVP